MLDYLIRHQMLNFLNTHGR